MHKIRYKITYYAKMFTPFSVCKTIFFSFFVMCVGRKEGKLCLPELVKNQKSSMNDLTKKKKKRDKILLKNLMEIMNLKTQMILDIRWKR